MSTTTPVTQTIAPAPVTQAPVNASFSRRYSVGVLRRRSLQGGRHGHCWQHRWPRPHGLWWHAGRRRAAL